MRVGIDFGGVIVEGATDEQRFNAARWREVDGAIESIAELVARTNGQVWIISKADKATQRLTWEWLAEKDFFQRTCFQPGHLRFCDKRIDKLKICRELKITNYIDDSSEVAASLIGAVPYIYLFGHDKVVEGIVEVKGWKQILEIVRDISDLS